MRIIDSTLLHLVGASFSGDPFVGDNLAYLRWSVDQRLGFPRTPFIVERRPSIRVEAGRHGLNESTVAVKTMKRDRHTGDLLHNLIRIATLPSGERILTFDMSAPSMRGGVCYVRLRFGGRGNNVSVELRAERDDRGERIVVDRITGSQSQLTFELAASRIDRVRIIHPDPLLQVTILTLAALDGAGWGSRMDVPIVTHSHLTRLPAPKPVDVFASNVLGGYRGPRLQHPLDGKPGADPATLPPSEPLERQTRYLDPWIQRIEPLVDRLFTDTEVPSPGERFPLHQSEVVELAQVSEFGTRGALQHPSTPVEVPIALTLAAAAVSDFHLAQLLGLAFVPEELVNNPPGVWDYRLTGTWDQRQLVTIEGMLQRRMTRMLADLRAGGLDAAATLDLAAEIARVDAELQLTVNLLQQWTQGGSEGLTVAAFAVGIRSLAHPRFAAPSGLKVRTRAPNVPGNRTAHADIGWIGRPCYRSGDDASGAYAAVLVRKEAAGTQFLNRPGPDPVVPGVRQPIVADDTTPRISDRTMPVNETITYAVCECDAFGRWSAYTRLDARKDYRVPPVAPPCEAALLEVPGQPGQVIGRLRFRWDLGQTWDGGRVSGEPAKMKFGIHLRRDAPPQPDLQAPASWGIFESRPGNGTAAFELRASASEGQVQHDGMTVTIAAPVDTVESIGARTRILRTYELHFDSFSLADQTDGRKRAWFAVSCIHDNEGASTGVGQPATAEYVPRTPPPTPALPPDPLLATWADADNHSFAKLTWVHPSGDPRAVWFQILSCGEAEIITAAKERNLPIAAAAIRDQALADYHNSGATLAQKSLALRTLAPFAENVFRIDQEMIPSGSGDEMAVTLRLSGSIITLTIYAVRGFSALGNPTSWPASASGFAVVKVPQAGFPSRPIILRAERDPVTNHVGVMVSEPAPRTLPVGAYELFRTTDPATARAGDHRRLALVNRFSVSANAWRSWVWFDDDLERVAGPNNTTVLRPRSRRVLDLVDTSPPTSGTVFYMVVAVANGDPGERSRSPASQPYALDMS